MKNAPDLYRVGSHRCSKEVKRNSPEETKGSKDRRQRQVRQYQQQQVHAHATANGDAASPHARQTRVFSALQRSHRHQHQAPKYPAPSADH